jgi:hypothetical protein
MWLKLGVKVESIKGIKNNVLKQESSTIKDGLANGVS